MNSNSMRSFFLPLLILALFFASALFLTLRQEFLITEGKRDLVILAYVDPRNPDDASFSLRHDSDTPRTLTLEYRYANGKTKTEGLTLAPHQQQLFSPSEMPTAITVRYQDSNHQEQTITISKKQ